MTHHFTLVAHPTEPTPTAKLSEIISHALVTVPGVSITLIPATPTADQAKVKIERYADKLTRLSATMSLVARDFDTVKPYGRELAKLKKQHAFTAEDMRRIERLERFAERTPMLARIRRFLVELPTEPTFEKLRFRQTLVLASLDLPRLVDEPAKLDGPVLQAFEEYHAEYVRLYLAMIERREAAIRDWRDHAPELDHMLDVLASLDTIPALGAPLAEALVAERARLADEYRPLGKAASELRRILNVEPTVAGLTLFAPDITPMLRGLATRIEAALREKLTVVCETSVARILAGSREPSVQKLTKLLSLTHLEKITQLFTKKTTPIIVRELATLLGETPITAVHFGDFTPSITAVATQTDIDNIVAEFRTFLMAHTDRTVIVK